MKREVLLFAEEILIDNKPLKDSAQSQVFIGICTETANKIVIKQIDYLLNPEALIKELQVHSLFTNGLQNN